MIRIVGIAGSLRKRSYNAGLLRAAAEAAPEGCAVQIETIRGIPLYDADLEEAEGVPAPAAELKDRIAAAAGLLIVTPEYNNSIPGVFKNAVDWLTRPPEDRFRVFKNRPVGIMGATPGSFGTAFSQYAWLPTFRVLGAQVWSGGLLRISGAEEKFDGDGNLTDEKTRVSLLRYMKGFAEFVRTVSSGGRDE
jgi:NAD(P)H-dependent FMN reductase